MILKPRLIEKGVETELRWEKTLDIKLREMKGFSSVEIYLRLLGRHVSVFDEEPRYW